MKLLATRDKGSTRVNFWTNKPLYRRRAKVWPILGQIAIHFAQVGTKDIPFVVPDDGTAVRLELRFVEPERKEPT